MGKKKVDVGLLLSALIISAILFGSGVFVGWLLNQERLNQIEIDMRSTMRSLQNFQLQFLFFDILKGAKPCPLLQSSLWSISDQTWSIGQKLTEHGTENEIKDEKKFKEALKEYYRLEISYWLLANKFKKVCKENVVTILFFISDDCDKKNNYACDNQGFVLDYFKRKFGKKLLIFTLNPDVSEPAIDVLKEYYNISVYPTIVIDDEKFEGFHPAKKIAEVLCSKGLCE